MKLVVILNVNPDENVKTKISKNREYTRRELKGILSDGFSGFINDIIFYDNFNQFKENVSNHLEDFVLNFDFGYDSRTRNMKVPSFCDNYNIKYFNPDPYVQVLCQDKFITKKFAENFGIKTPQSLLVFSHSYNKELLKNFNYPVIIKPATTGSSIGISTAKDKKELEKAIDEAINYDSKIIVEEMIPNLMEVNISVLGNHASQEVSVIEEVLSTHNFLTFEEKYVGSSKVKGKLGAKLAPRKGSKGMASASRKIPADLTDKMQKEVEDLAVRVFKALGSSGVARIDMLVDKKAKKVYVNEINSIPGSLAFYLWDKKGKDYTTLLDEMINIAVKDYKTRTSKVHTFDNNILQGFANNNGLKGMKGKLK